MRETFHKELDSLDENLLELVSLCEESIEAALKVLLKNKSEKLKKVIELRDTIDKNAYLAEDSCMKMLLRQQPLAGDMNTIAYSLKLIRDMQRIGTQAVDLAVLAKEITELYCSNYLYIMADDIIQMLKDSITAFINKDSQLAESVIKRDDILDSNYLKIKNELSQKIFSSQDQAGNAIDILMVAKYLERIGDHTVNIARWIIEIV